MVAGLAILSVVAIGSYFIFCANNQPTLVPPSPTAQPNTPASEPQQPDATGADNRSRHAATAVLAMLQSYAVDNNGAYPVTASELNRAVDTYGKLLPSSTTVTYRQSYSFADAPDPTEIFYYPGYTCTGTDPTLSSSRQVAVRYALGAGTYECDVNS